jgi:hypothetical protein
MAVVENDVPVVEGRYALADGEDSRGTGKAEKHAGDRYRVQSIHVVLADVMSEPNDFGR